MQSRLELWYDFFLYATASALVFAKLFFPTFDPVVGTIAAFGTFAVGYVARPIGAVFFGHFGDRIGRKTTLVATLMIMGVATFIIGILPTYETIGVWAPALLILMRFRQGLGVGGEWGGAVLLVVESAPKDKRRYYGSFLQLGVPIGLLLSTGVFALVSSLPEDQFLAWRWCRGSRMKRGPSPSDRCEDDLEISNSSEVVDAGVSARPNTSSTGPAFLRTELLHPTRADQHLYS